MKTENFANKRVLITGSSGLIGSEATKYFDDLGAQVHGVDNNMREDFFGPDGDTTWNLNWLRENTQRFKHHDLDIRDREKMREIVAEVGPHLIIHAAAQPSHDLAEKRPFDDFDINATGTLNMLEAVRNEAADAVFIHLSTNKVYGDAPNEIPRVELEHRWDYADVEFADGIDENLRIDQSVHSVFGASKVAADVMAQEYGKNYGLKVGVFRGGCLTGSRHSGAELHGFLSYLFKCGKHGRPYTIFGYKGKQVRDQIHSLDVIRAAHAFFDNPRPGEVYNIGGGRDNSISVLEAVARAEQYSGNKMQISYSEANRTGDHICYISDLGKLKAHYPEWGLSRSLDQICEEIWAAV